MMASDNDPDAIYQSATSCLCGAVEYYRVFYIPEKDDSYAVCCRCGALRQDEPDGRTINAL